MASLPENTHPNTRKQEYTLLLVDDEESAKDRLELALTDCGRGLATAERLRILHAPTLARALDLLGGNSIHIALLDKNLGAQVPVEDRNGIEAIPDMLRLQPHLQILVLTGSGDFSDVVRAMDLGAVGFLSKEKPDELLIAQINRLLQSSLERIQALRTERGMPSDSIDLGGKSKAFQRVLKSAGQVAENDLSVLLLGQSGTGKTEIARWMHRKREQALKLKSTPFFGINVSALSREVIESELFGHEKGAYTDAHEAKAGLFELAENGVLFLDEIGELPLDLQPKLLKVVEEGTYMRMGGKEIKSARVKLIFATHRNLGKMVAEGAFRHDLHMRISGFPIEIPPLSERVEDIPDIIKALLPKVCSKSRVFVRFEDIPQDFIDYLIKNPVEGNIRGLQHQLERLLVLAPKDKHGKPVLTRWRTISGFDARVSESDSAKIDLNQLGSVPITYSELLRRPWSLLTSDFPGLKEALAIFRKKILDEASSKFELNRDIARALRISQSTSSGRKRSKGSEGCPDPT